jgi:hypothetical protein
VRNLAQIVSGHMDQTLQSQPRTLIARWVALRTLAVSDGRAISGDALDQDAIGFI